MTDKPKLLIIDDDPMTRMLTSEVLGKNGFDIVEAENGRQGISLFAETHPDLVLLDVIMPEMDGFECLRLLCGEFHSQVPIVMMTAVEDVHCIELAYQLGAADFIGKPIQWLLLPYRIRFVMRNHQLNQLLLKQQRQLQQSEQQLRLSLSASKQGLWDLDLQTGMAMLSEEYCAMLGFNSDLFASFSLEQYFTFIHPDDYEHVKSIFNGYLKGELNEYRVEFRQRCADGSWKWILSLGGIVETGEFGEPLRMKGTYTDIHDSKIANEKLLLLAKVFENSGEGIILCDAVPRIISSNQAYTRITGYSQTEALNTTPHVFSEQQGESCYQDLCKAVRGNSYWQGEIWDVRKNGETYPVSLGISTIRNAKGVITHYIGIFSDITERKAAEAKIARLAHYDPLTNLPNRTLLRDRFAQAMAHSIRNNTLVAILFLDLDRFKQINDTLGHNVGDRLLQGIAERLCLCVRQVDTVCRQGGDEFIIILTDIPHVDIVTRIAETILENLHQPFSIEGVTVATSFSIGISLFPLDGVSFHGLLTKADTAMYAAKGNGRNQFMYFAHDMNLAAIERTTIRNGLQRALENHEFYLNYQPLYDLQDNKIIGIEALLRWQPNPEAIMAPKKFIPIAEENGLMEPIGNWVLQQACLQNRRWHDAGLKLLVTVNISIAQFEFGNFVESVKSALAISGLDPQFLQLELTESILMINTESVIETLEELQAFGVQFALDDFGAGYSSFTYLKRFAISKLKIDQPLVNGLISGKDEDIAVIEGIINLGLALGLRVLAKGVETREQVDQLVRLGCNEGQGFFWHPPMPPQDLDNLLKQH